MRSLKHLIIIFFASATLACNSAENKHPSKNIEISAISETFAKLQSKSIDELAQVIQTNGIYFCRVFTSGNLGGRGQDHCANYKATDLYAPDGLIAKVENETPTDILWLFPVISKTPENGSLEIELTKAQVISELTSPSRFANELVAIIDRIKIDLDMTPAAIIDDNRIVVIDGQIIDDRLVGGVIVIELDKNQLHSIEAIYDFR